MYSLSSSGLPVSRGLFDFEKKDPPSETCRQIHVPYEDVVLNNQTFTHRFILLKWEYAGWEYIGGETLDSTGKVVMRLFGAYVHSERKNRYESIFDAADSMDQMMLDMCNNLFDQSGRPTGNFQKKLKETACWYGDGYDIGNILFIQGVYARTADEDMYRDMGLHDDMVRSLIYNMGWLKEKNGNLYDVNNKQPEDDVNLDELEEEEKYNFDIDIVIGAGVENCKKRFQKIAEKGKQKDLYFMLPHEIGWPFCPHENGVAPPMSSNNVDDPNEGLQGQRSSLDTDHEKHFKKLRAEIHPDKHRNCKRANQLFQSLTDFYEESLGENKSTPVRKRTKTSYFPLNFSSNEKWPYVNARQMTYIPKEKSIGSLVAYQCINSRGSIVHGKKTRYSYSPKDKNDQRSAKKVFEAIGGYKLLSTPDEIKAELMARGPIVSTSFQLSNAFLSSVEDRNRFFNSNLKSKVHDVLITGWKHTSMGEVWQICPLVYETLEVEEECFNIGFGQYDIDRVCVAPKNTFEGWSWESGPYFQKSMSNERDEWYSWQIMNFSIDSKQLEELSEAVGGDLIDAATSKKKFTLQDSRKKAHSRSCILKNVKHEKDKSHCWRISVDFE
ncbi:predicted protein [Chaetoceros tenuissimus]|uniref:Uncharacterized protein n=1 Tax=Chaetoceros tenuissimus TaxID=426638 RepID=A0AAD3H272_9STRA|nr:predicted protein [Chaetoceros tenuissimus]